MEPTQETINNAKQLHSLSWISPELKSALENDFPELKENEDEKIREDLIGGLMWQRDNLDRLGKHDDSLILPGFCHTVGEHLTYLKRQKEQNSKDEEYTDFTIYHPTKNGKGEYECIPYSFYGSLTSFSEDKDLIDFLRTCFYTEEECNKWIEQQKDQKPEIKYVYPIFKVGDTIKPKAYNESHRINEIKDDNYVLDNGFTFSIVGQDVWEIVEQKPYWKPNEEQMIALRQVISGCSYDIEPLVEIEEHLKKLMEE